MECIDWNQTDTRINAICQIICSIWVFLLPLVGLPLILLSIISYNSPSCVKTWPIHRCFLFQIEFSSCLSSFTILRTSSVVTLSSQLIFSILLHIHISKASSLLLSVCVNVHISAAYSATLHTKHFIILFFSSRIIVPVNNFFLHKYFLRHLNSAPNLFCAISILWPLIICVIWNRVIYVILFSWLWFFIHSVLLCCWLGDWKGIRPAKISPAVPWFLL